MTRNQRRLRAMTANEAALEVAADRVMLRLERGGDPVDDRLAEVLAVAKPGAELELAGICGAVCEDDLPLPAWLAD